MTKEELQQHAKLLGKHDRCFISDMDGTYLLCGTPLAFDEIIEERMMMLIHDLVAIFGGNDSEYDYDGDAVATARDDHIRELVVKGLGVKDVIYGTLEF